MESRGIDRKVLLAVTLGWLEKAWKGIPRALKLQAIRLQAVKEESELHPKIRKIVHQRFQ